MRILVVYTHPYSGSLAHAALERVLKGLEQGRHEVKVIDLYAEGFDPVISPAEWETYMQRPAEMADAPQKDHYARLNRAEGLVFVQPTWMFSAPAMLKGWLERVLVPGVAFSLPSDDDPLIKSLLRRIRMVAVVTSTGTPWYVMRAAGMPLKTLLLRSIRLGFAVRCETIWLCLHGMDLSTPDQRAKHLDKVEKRFAQVK